MFTLTFMKDKSKTTISVMRYDFAEFDGGQAAVVTASKDYLNGGVEYRLGDGTPANQYYTTCFVTNEAGKTIDRLGPYPPKDYELKSATA